MWNFRRATSRTLTAAAYDPVRDQLVIFGGQATIPGDEIFNDTWIFAGGGWSQASPRSGPTPRVGAAMTFDRNLERILLFGGGGGPLLRDTWSWDGVQWVQLQAAHSPSPRQNAGLVYHDEIGASILFGGVGIEGTGTIGRLNDTWMFNGGDWLSVGTAVAPPGGDSRTLCYSAGRAAAVLLNPAESGSKVGSSLSTWLL